MIGENNAQLLNQKLALHGVFLEDPELTLEKVAYGINQVMGVNVAEFIIDKILLQLDGQMVEPLIKDQ
jgi:hypothetical protein